MTLATCYELTQETSSNQDLCTQKYVSSGETPLKRLYRLTDPYLGFNILPA